MGERKKEQTREQTIEEIFDSLQEVVQQLESEDISLEDSFALYNQGMQMLKQCNEKIDTVEKQVMMLDENGESHEF